MSSNPRHPLPPSSTAARHEVATYRFVVHGRVQGVWYRASCRRRALELGLNGWARNLPDGAVEVVARGPETAVNDLLVWCRHGPPAAVVTNVDIEPVPDDPYAHLLGFDTR